MSQEQVLADWVQGEGDPTALAGLHDWLRADPQHRQWARDELALHLALRARLQPADAAAIATLVDEVGVGRTGARTTQRQRVARACLAAVAARRRQRWLRGMAALAAGLLLIVSAAMLGTSAPANPEAQPRAPLIAQAETAIGHVTTVHGTGQLERAGVRRGLVAGEALQAGDRLVADPGSTIAWVDDDSLAELELRGGDCVLRPQPAASLAIHAGQLRVATWAAQAAPLQLLAAAAVVEVQDAILQVAITAGGTRLEVERGQALLLQAGLQHVVTRDQPAFSDAGGSYRVLFHFRQTGPTRDPRVAYGDPQPDPSAPDGWSLRGVLLDGAREVYFAGDLPTVEDAGELRITYRIVGLGPLRVFSHHLAEQTDITAELGQVAGPAWHTAIIRWSDFHRQGPQFEQPGAFPGNHLRNLVIASDRPATVTELHIDEVLYLAPARP